MSRINESQAIWESYTAPKTQYVKYRAVYTVKGGAREGGIFNVISDHDPKGSITREIIADNDGKIRPFDVKFISIEKA